MGEKVGDGEIGGVAKGVDEEAGVGNVFGRRESAGNWRESERSGRGRLGVEEEVG